MTNQQIFTLGIYQTTLFFLKKDTEWQKYDADYKGRQKSLKLWGDT